MLLGAQCPTGYWVFPLGLDVPWMMLGTRCPAGLQSLPGSSMPSGTAPGPQCPQVPPVILNAPSSQMFHRSQILWAVDP